MVADSDRNSAFTVESLARAHRLAGNRDEAMRSSADLISKVSTATGFEPQQGWLEGPLLAGVDAGAGRPARQGG